MRLVASVAALVVLHLFVALAPAEPRLFGTPFGLVLELAVVGLSTLNLWLAVRILLAEAEADDPAGGAGTSDQAPP